MKEVLREFDETKLSRDDIITQAKDSEKKIQTLEAEVLQLTEVCALKKRASRKHAILSKDMKHFVNSCMHKYVRSGAFCI